MKKWTVECGISDKSHGNMSVRAAFEVDSYVLGNRRTFLPTTEKSLGNVVSCLVDCQKYRVVNVKNASRQYLQADALVTTNPDIILTVTAADCYPVFLWDEQVGVVAMVHASWRSAASRIIARTIGMMQELGAKDVVAAIGPGLKAANFEVDTDSFVDEFAYLRRKSDELNRDFVAEYLEPCSQIGKSYFDLLALITYDLEASHVLIEEVNDNCTYSSDQYYSFRADGFDQHGKIRSQLAYIKLSINN